MCNCIEELKKRMIEQKKNDKKFKDAYNFKVECDNIATVFRRSTPKTYDRPYLEFKLTANYITKNGNERTRKEENGIMFSYCPYCGEKYRDED